MRTTLLALAAFSTVAVAQDFIHYKFDERCTNEVVNYATGPQALASNGTLQTTSTSSAFDVGMFGGCLAGGSIVTPTYYNRVVTGWNPSTQNVVGDLTMAWFMKQRNPLGAAGTSLCYLMGAPSGGFRLFTNGVAGRGLYQREIVPSGGNGGTSGVRDFQLPAATYDVQAAAAVGWVHIAMVFDSTAQTADWYVNGVSVLQLSGVPGASITLNGPFQIGYYSSASVFDIDEFLMSFRAYSPAEIMVLSLAQQAGDGDYLSGSTTQCGSLGLAGAGSRPFLGNAGYALTVTPAAPSFFAVLFGFDRCSYGGVLPLPMDGGMLAPIAAGCTVLADNLTNVGGLALTGPATLPFGIPAVPGFAGLEFFGQAVSIDLSTFAVSASNGLAISVGQ